ncbi:hypothetical protein BDN70DRAFT_842083 [Pholiota conissans]|uniref:MYND-type domain-containing protein n=1 Tax=Pholiota conissans TaxID=109636 RepID=A0A9P6CQ17_9AGAR|nr:hypothetical protein BDN70DRAFT_842083 [Pholiota conissans]
MPSKKRNQTQGYQVPDRILGGQRFTVRPGSGLVVTDEMRQILAQPGFIKDKEGGSRLRRLYIDHSIGFNPNELSEFGMACFVGAFDAVQQALESGTHPSLDGTVTAFQAGYATILIWGSQRIPNDHRTRHLDTLRLLVSHKLPLDIPDICGFTALHHFAINPNSSSRDYDLLRLMLESGANPNVQDRYGVVPIYPTFEQIAIPGIELFMEFGADLDIEDADGITPNKVLINMGPEVTAAVQKWLRKRAGIEAARQDKCCEGCLRTDVVLKNCARCQVGRYCSKECQRTAWPTHRRICRLFSESATATLKPFYVDFPFTTIVSTSNLVRQANGITPAPTTSTKKVKPLDYPKDIVIKVQIAMSRGSPMMIYTKRKDFLCHVRRSDAPRDFDIVENVVMTKGFSGLKAYFAATLKSENELVVKIADVLAEQPF